MSLHPDQTNKEKATVREKVEVTELEKPQEM